MPGGRRDQGPGARGRGRWASNASLLPPSPAAPRPSAPSPAAGSAAAAADLVGDRRRPSYPHAPRSGGAPQCRRCFGRSAPRPRAPKIWALPRRRRRRRPSSAARGPRPRRRLTSLSRAAGPGSPWARAGAGLSPSPVAAATRRARRRLLGVAPRSSPAAGSAGSSRLLACSSFRFPASRCSCSLRHFGIRLWWPATTSTSPTTAGGPLPSP